MKKILVAVLILVSDKGYTQTYFPGKQWHQYANVSEAGFSDAGLDKVKEIYSESRGSALLIVQNGAIALSMGDPARKFMDHSMRKSYLSALYGVLSASGKLGLDESLEQLDIDDIQKLSKAEREATVEDLLSGRSGVYHPSAYSPPGMSEGLPQRGSHAHGTRWVYNNWDFNVLATIFKQKARIDVFSAFEKAIAVPLGMEDFLLSDSFYRNEPKVSNHPAYLFRLSARDEARFGLLFLRKGKWNGKQLIPETWVRKSTSTISTMERPNSGYGYLWWTSTVGQHQCFYASGSNGQGIVVFPSLDMVVVHSVNTYDMSNRVSNDEIFRLLTAIVEAKTGKVAEKAQLVPFVCEVPQYRDYTISPGLTTLWTRRYLNPVLGPFRIDKTNTKWELYTNIGIFVLHPRSDNEFVLEDIPFLVVMEKALIPEDVGKVIVKKSSQGKMEALRFLY